MSKSQLRRETDKAEAALSTQHASELRAVVVARAWRDLRKFLTLFFAATTLLGAYHAVRLRYGDVHDYYAYSGTTGPLTVVEDASGQLAAGRMQTVFSPGDHVGWVASLCTNVGVAYTAHILLVRVEEQGAQATTVASHIVRYDADAHRCGPKFSIFGLTPDAVPGSYRIHRYAIFREGSWWPLQADFPDVPFTVVASATVPVQSTNRPTDNP